MWTLKPKQLPKKVEEAEPQSKMTGFELNVHVGDLFVEPQPDVSLAHCVSRDLAMSAGIAKIFRKKFKHIQELEDQKANIGEIAVLKVKQRFIFSDRNLLGFLMENT